MANGNNKHPVYLHAMGRRVYPLNVLLSLLLISSSVNGRPDCPLESARNIPSGTIPVTSNTGWMIGGWGYASPFNAKNFGDDQYNWGSSNFGYGNFGDNNTGNRNFGNGNLGDRNLGNYNLGRDNCGNYNVGHGNEGQWNVGKANSGSYNLGKGNSGVGNTGIGNSGNNNVGGLNSGTNNLGVSNSGQSNYGTENSGTENVGWNNAGNWNIGADNSGNGNVGWTNTNGNFNLGFLNSGSNNTGGWNNGQGNVGYLSGVKSSTITSNISGNGIYWKNVTNLVLDVNPAIGSTGWANLNQTNVGIGQSGYNNVGIDNLGGFNIGKQLNGTENTGRNLTGTGLIGLDKNNGPGFSSQGVTIQGIPNEDGLLDSTVYGFLQDNLSSAFPETYEESINEMIQSNLTPFNPPTCQTFTPVQVSNTFSVSVRCRGSIKITDLYCSGDSFVVYKDGKLWLTTPVVSLNNDPQCLNSQTDPEEAFYDPEYSHVQGWLPSGSYRITIVPATTRWGGGAVAIKVDDFCDRTAVGNYIRF